MKSLRYEYKHIIHNSKLPDFRAAIASHVQLDPYAAACEAQQYTVRSIYFDTCRWSMYHEKLEGLAFRDKIRLRAYNEYEPQAKVFLEIKRKYQLPTRKFRVALPLEQLPALFGQGDIAGVLHAHKNPTQGMANASRFFYQIYLKQLLPVVLISYEREPYIGQGNPENNVRITLDKSIRAYPFPGLDELFTTRSMRKVFQHHTVIEVKFNHYFPRWLKPIMAGFQLSKVAFSKYVAGVDALQLPRRFARPVQLRSQARLWKYGDPIPHFEQKQ
ncbi:MAG: polyphosphate polymerase domain-containing protein [Bacteroidetes bacterium]|nr:MAG: polyphosphate polymerase domain-containing protein [Bacteroidota bacterium]